LDYLMPHALSPIGKDRAIARYYALTLSNAVAFFHTQSRGEID
jgi:hypothetical protein